MLYPFQYQLIQVFLRTEWLYITYISFSLKIITSMSFSAAISFDFFIHSSCSCQQTESNNGTSDENHKKSENSYSYSYYVPVSGGNPSFALLPFPPASSSLDGTRKQITAQTGENPKNYAFLEEKYKYTFSICSVVYMVYRRTAT